MNHHQRDCVFGEDACLTRTGLTNRASLDNIALAVIFANRRESLAEIPPFYATDSSQSQKTRQGWACETSGQQKTRKLNAAWERLGWHASAGCCKQTLMTRWLGRSEKGNDGLHFMEQRPVRDNPLYNQNRMKIGIIAMNCSHGSTITTADNSWEMTWPDTREVSVMADRAGFEILLPVARWRGYGGETNFNNRTFETYNWAAGVAAITDYSCIFSTSHVPLTHPVAAAKQCATIDHISGGRFALNVVCGWFKNEFEMFNAEWREHDVRYEYATEWLDLVRRIWTEENEFDFEGRWFTSRNIWSQPKPIQKPMPPVMNAGGSQAGQKFAATQADMNFVILKQRDIEGGRTQIRKLKNMAREAGREVQSWIHVYVVCRETEKEARDYLNHYVVERGDYVAVNNLLKIFGMQSETLPPDVLDEFRFHFIAGHGGYPLVGTAEQIVDEIDTLVRIGVDGILISWVDYKTECRQWIDEVMPLMEQAGQRRPFEATGG